MRISWRFSEVSSERVPLKSVFRQIILRCHQQVVSSSGLSLLWHGIHPLFTDNLLRIPDTCKDILSFEPGIFF